MKFLKENNHQGVNATSTLSPAFINALRYYSMSCIIPYFLSKYVSR